MACAGVGVHSAAAAAGVTVINAKSAADNGLLVDGVGKAEAGPKVLVPGGDGSIAVAISTRGAVAPVEKSARSPGDRVRDFEIDEGEDVMLLRPWRVDVPTQAGIDRQL